MHFASTLMAFKSQSGVGLHLVALGTSIVLEGVHDPLEQGDSHQAVLIVLPDDLG